MANWQHILDLKDVWDQYEEGQAIDYLKAGQEIAARIRSADFFNDSEDALEEIASLFEEAVDTDDFDFICEQLWNWGDRSQETPIGHMQRRNCWIKTF